MASKAEKAALEILQGSSAYNQLYHQLDDEQAELLWKAIWEQQILTICQSIWHRKQWTCQAWRDAMHDWLGEVVKDYHRHFDKDEPRGDSE